MPKTTLIRIGPAQSEVTCRSCKQVFFTYREVKYHNYCSRECFTKDPQKRRKITQRTDPQVCTKCRTSFPLAEYPLNKGGKPGLRCRNCVQPSPEAKRRSHLWTKFKMTIEDWVALYERQNGKCPICTIQLPDVTELLQVTDRNTPWKWRNWNTDHCHATGKVRGILCRQCNMGLGAFRDNPEFCRSAAEYLVKHGK